MAQGESVFLVMGKQAGEIDAFSGTVVSAMAKIVWIVRASNGWNEGRKKGLEG